MHEPFQEPEDCVTAERLPDANQWISNFDCETTKTLDALVELPLDETCFDENYNQRTPLQLKDRVFAEELEEFIDKAIENIDYKKIK